MCLNVTFKYIVAYCFCFYFTSWIKITYKMADHHPMDIVLVWRTRWWATSFSVCHVSKYVSLNICDFIILSAIKLGLFPIFL